LETGGAEITLYKLLSHLDTSVFDCKVISLSDVGTIGKRIQDLGINVQPLHMKSWLQNPMAFRSLVRRLKQLKPDIVQTWMYHANLIGLLATFFSGKIPVIWNIRASRMDLSQYTRQLGWTVKACALFSKYTNAIIVNSLTAREDHIQLGYRAPQWIHIPNGIDTNEFRPNPVAYFNFREELNLSGDVFLVGMIARFDPKKDHQTFLQAAHILSNDIPSVKFILCGRGITEDNLTIMSQVESLSLKNSVFLLGEREDISRIMAALDIASSSSAFGEGFPNTIAEAMACGVPCVVTDVGDSAQVVGETGIVVPARNPDALAKAWMQIFDKVAAGGEQLKQLSRQRIENQFHLSEMVRKYSESYKRIAYERQVTQT
jgi:glycosyltransferase involved in cell wall biosynthesis